MFGGILAGVWGCFAVIFVVFWRDLGGKVILEKLKKKHINKLILIFLFCNFLNKSFWLQPLPLNKKSLNKK